jgi:hypothetical protein
MVHPVQVRPISDDKGKRLLQPHPGKQWAPGAAGRGDPAQLKVIKGAAIMKGAKVA